MRSEQEVKAHFDKGDKTFALGLGQPILRKQLTELFESWGGELTSLISPKANIGNFGIEIGEGATILSNATITSSVKIGKGLLMYPNAVITHDCVVGDFVELSPGATLLGNVTVGTSSQIGANSTILSGLTVGEGCLVGAGSVVTRNLAHCQTVKGVPAR